MRMLYGMSVAACLVLTNAIDLLAQPSETVSETVVVQPSSLSFHHVFDNQRFGSCDGAVPMVWLTPERRFWLSETPPHATVGHHSSRTLGQSCKFQHREVIQTILRFSVPQPPFISSYTSARLRFTLTRQDTRPGTDSSGQDNSCQFEIGRSWEGIGNRSFGFGSSTDGERHTFIYDSAVELTSTPELRGFEAARFDIDVTHIVESWGPGDFSYFGFVISPIPRFRFIDFFDYKGEPLSGIRGNRYCLAYVDDVSLEITTTREITTTSLRPEGDEQHFVAGNCIIGIGCLDLVFRRRPQ